MNVRLNISSRLLAGLLSQSGAHSQKIHDENRAEALRLADLLILECEEKPEPDRFLGGSWLTLP